MKASVVLAWCSAGEVRTEFARSLAASLMRTPTAAVIDLTSGPRIAEARNQIVDGFATTDAEWLWMVDSDMVFAPDCLERLLVVADRTAAPIVGALCRTSKGAPTMFRFDADGEPQRVVEWDEGVVLDVDATGTGCVLIHRRVFAALKNKYGTLPSGAENPYPWFVEGATTPKGAVLGEDTAFMLRARSLGIPVKVATGVKVGHVKMTVIGEVA